MPRTHRGRLLIAFVISSLLGISAQESGRAATEQTYFHEDQDLENPVVLPIAVVNAILKTDEGKQGLSDAKQRRVGDVNHLFRGTRIHLNDNNDADFLVIGTFPMSGADNTWFWMVSSAPPKPRVLLFAGCNSVEIMRDKTNGYRNIRCLWSSASETGDRVYEFENERYRLSKDH
jgi:hypothetical protein